MIGCKAEFTFLCITGLLVVFHWSEAAKYDDNPGNEGKFHDLGESEFSVDDLKDEDTEASKATLDLGRQMWNRRRLFTTDRRRRTHSSRRRRSRRRRWGW